MNILFVCTTNECLSPMASAIFNHLIKKEGITRIVSESAGIKPIRGNKTNPLAIQALANIEIYVKPKRIKKIKKRKLKYYNYVITLTTSQKLAILELNKGRRRSIYSLDDLSMCGDINDPSGDNIIGFNIIAEEIVKELTFFVQSIKNILMKKHKLKEKAKVAKTTPIEKKDIFEESTAKVEAVNENTQTQAFEKVEYTEILTADDDDKDI